MMTEPATTGDPTARQVPDVRLDLADLILFHGGEWTEADYEALPRGVRAELHDGRLILVPSAEPSHMLASIELAVMFRGITGDRRRVLQEVDVRMAGGRRYRTPDLLVLHRWHRKRPIPPSDVLLVGEIISPGGGEEYGDKMTAYFDAGIEWYLIVEETPAGFQGELYRLGVEKYELVSQAPAAGALELPAPFGASINLRDLS
jgi:hypothetical protein